MIVPTNLILCMVCFVSVIVLHEIGHVDAFRRLGRKSKIVSCKGGLEIKADYKGLKNDQLLIIYLEGVIAGAVPIVGFAFFVTPVFILFAIPYAMMSRHDIKQIIRVNKQ